MDLVASTSRHNRNNASCRYPGMACVCGDEASSYLLDDCGDDDDDDQSMRRTIEFYNVTDFIEGVEVDYSTTAAECCQMLSERFRVLNPHNYVLVEYWGDHGCERTLEDHECILKPYRESRRYTQNMKQSRWVFRKERNRYDWMKCPERYFPSEMMNFDTTETGRLNDLLVHDARPPVIVSNVWYRDPKKTAWSKKVLLLRYDKLYMARKMVTFRNWIDELDMDRRRTARQRVRDYGNFFKRSPPEYPGVTSLGRITDYILYTPLNAAIQWAAPKEHGFCLRPIDFKTGDKTEIKCFTCESEPARSCWVYAMRLSKYGHQLWENYKTFFNKKSETKDYEDLYENPPIYIKDKQETKVAMDFTGPVGRIIDDPREAQEVAANEKRQSWKRRWRPRSSDTSPGTGRLLSTQPWFHNETDRDEAVRLISKYKLIDGVYLVRDSRTHPGSFVITYVYRNKVAHAQINCSVDSFRRVNVYSLDFGVTRFYNIMQLVEFYQLNSGGHLPTRLTNYIQESTKELSTEVEIISPKRKIGRCKSKK